MKYDFLIKKQKEAIEAMETVIEECGKNCMSCVECSGYNDNAYRSGCIFTGIPDNVFLVGLNENKNTPIVEAAVTLQIFCSNETCEGCVFAADQGSECIIDGCPALWEKRLQLLKNKEEEK